jgi:hypothetical protein
MFLEASEIFDDYGITLLDTADHDADIVKKNGIAVTPLPKQKKSMSMDDVVKLVHPAQGNEINVLFTHSISGCRSGDTIGCSDAGANVIAIGENLWPWSDYEKGRRVNEQRFGLNLALAHEIGHQFMMPHVSAYDRSGYCFFLMCENSRYRKGSDIDGSEVMFLKSTTVVP